jgi:hypothetical protein
MTELVSKKESKKIGKEGRSKEVSKEEGSKNESK